MVKRKKEKENWTQNVINHVYPLTPFGFVKTGEWFYDWNSLHQLSGWGSCHEPSLLFMAQRTDAKCEASNKS